MTNNDYASGVRKANKAIASLDRLLPKKSALKLYRGRVGKSFFKMLKARDRNDAAKMEFYKGMWAAYSYYIAEGRRLDERQDILS